MKFTIETGILHSALGIASVAVDSRMTLPILGNVKIHADRENETISITTTNLDLFVRQILPSKRVAKPGAITVPFNRLRTLVGDLDATETEFELEKKILKIRSGDYNAIFETLPEDEFPPMPKQKSNNPVSCDANELLTPLRKVFHAVSHDELRYNLNGINFYGEQFAASDGRRLAIYTSRAFTAESVIVPNACIKALLAIEPSGEIKVVISDGLISVESSAVKLVCKLVEANYPNISEVVKMKPGNEIFGCDRADLIRKLKTCAKFKDGMTAALTMTGRGNEIEVAKDEQIKAMVMGCELAGQPKFTKRFNSNFLLDALRVLEEKNVAIHCSEKETTFVIQEGPFRAVIQGMLME